MPELTGIDKVTVSFVEPDDGGSPILGFEVQIDGGDGDGFTSITGEESDFKELRMIVRNL